MMKRNIFLLSCVLLIALISCRKERISSDDPTYKLSFSTDTVCFDTVFTSVGSSTRRLIIYNPNAERINISDIRLKNGNTSSFVINIDGLSGTEFNNLEIESNDSLFAFIRVTIDPLNQNLPYIVEDELIFNTNSNTQSVNLLAYGQDAVYIVADQHINGYPNFKIIADSLETTVWTAERPYVIYGYALIDSYGTLRIEAGTHIYIHNGGGIWAYSEGQLLMDGTAENPIVIQGDRLEDYYTDLPGQWDRIWLMEARSGHPHHINHAIIRNGFIGVQAEAFLKLSAEPLIIENSIIDNHSGMGIYTTLYDLNASNFAIGNCSQYGIALTYGGSHRLIHGTIANSPRNTRKTASLFMSNSISDGVSVYVNNFNLEVGNCIVYGNIENEIASSMYEGADSNYVFKNCLIKTKRDTTSAYFTHCIFNKNPLLTDYKHSDYHIDTIISPLIGRGLIDYAIEVPLDLDQVSRTATPDIGAYQFVNQ